MITNIGKKFTKCKLLLAKSSISPYLFCKFHHIYTRLSDKCVGEESLYVC